MIRSISLAPLKYNQKVFDKFFETISIRRHELLDGTKVFTANSYLKKSLIPKWKEINQLYSSCDGSGTSIYENEAIYKSISEGIERLAFYNNIDNKKLGFNIDCSTNGLAAFPGLFQSSARQIALAEAIERWSIHEFWAGRLGITNVTSKIDFKIFYLQAPFKGYFSLICYKNFLKNGVPRRAYGFAAGFDRKNTLFRATVEMSRNFEVLNIFDDSKNDISNILEQRLLFFSREEGFKIFDKKTSDAEKFSSHNLIRPNIIIDNAVQGIWKGTCYVHRILFDGMRTDNSAKDIFSF